jgi:hypothetical protein
MADGVSISAGVGTTVLTDDTGAGGHAQVVKLAISTDGSGTLIPADATNGIDVDVTRLPSLVAGTAYVGKVSLTDGTNDLTVDTVHGDAESNTENHLDVASKLMGYNGTTWDRLRTDTTNGLDVDVTRVGGTVTTGGDVAHDTADSGNPIKIGGVAVSGSATPTSVAASDRVRFIANQHGIPYTIAGHPNLITREFDFGTTAKTDEQLSAAVVAADERIYVTRFEALVDNATTVSVSVRAGFGTASVPTASATGVNGMIASHPGIAPGSGIICGNGSGIIAVGGAGEEPRLTTSAATTGNLHVVISYFLIDETP